MIKTNCNPMFIKKEVIFGSGDVQQTMIKNKDIPGVGIGLSNTEKGEIGRKVNSLTTEEEMQKLEVALFFKNKESLESLVGFLNEAKTYFEEA